MNNQTIAKIQAFLDQFMLSSEQKAEYLQNVVSILYIDLFERVAKTLPEPERSQALSYLTNSRESVDAELHENIKKYIEQNVTTDVMEFYLNENLDKILSKIAEAAHLVQNS